MNLNRILYGILLPFLFSSVAYAQATPKTLLWRISGHGLAKPSYLYGTMHLNDKRLFSFGDSVYHAIEKSEGLAIEINPDELAGYYVNKLFDQMENSKKLQELLNESDFKKYSSGLAKKFGKPANEITTGDVVKEKNKWMAEYMEKGEMPTFVDAYLYNIGRRQGKWLGGIEDMADQTGLLEDLVDKSDIEYLLAGASADKDARRNEAMEQLIDLYTSQNIDGLDMLLNDPSSPEIRDRILIKRNIKMARRIDSLSNLRSMFLAIGAAHLPGDSGVIYLLRKKGFTVEPVFSSAKIAQKDYTFKEIRLPWFSVEDSQHLYKTMMPGNPATIKLYGIIEMKFLLDIFNMSGFCTMAVVSAVDFANKDSIYSTTAMRMFQTDKPPVPKLISNNGIEGREYMQQKKGACLRVQIFMYNKAIYLSFMYAMKPAQLSSEDANTFFASLAINKAPIVRKASFVFTDSVMGISFTAPATISYNKKLSTDSTEGWKISAFSGTDINTGTYISVYSKEVRPGHYVKTDSIIYTEFANNIKRKNIVLQQDDRLLQGYKVQRIIGRNIAEPVFYMNTINLLKNGRNIVILTVSDSTHLHSPGNENMFASLHFIDHPAVPWQIYTRPDSLFHCWAPGILRASLYQNGKKQQFYSYDSTTAVSYSIIPDTLSKYFWASNDSSYWKKQVTDNLGADSLIQQISISNGAIHGVELLFKEQKNESIYKRMRLLQDGDKLYKLFVSAEKQLLYNDNTNRFFNSFTVKKEALDTHFIFTSKTAILLHDLAANSASRKQAYTALEDAPMTPGDREAMQQVLFKKYQSLYDSTESTVINYELASKLAGLKDIQVVDFIKTHYNQFEERIDTLKNLCLSLLAHLHTRESYSLLAQLLQQSPPRQPLDYHLTSGLKDSLLLTAGIYPLLQSLAADTLYAANIAGIANALLDSGLISIDKIKPAEKAFIKSAAGLLPVLLKSDLRDFYIYQLISILGRLNTPSSNGMLRNYLAVKSLWLRKDVAIKLLKNNQSVASAMLNVMAADKSMRNSLYHSLKEIGKIGLFPAGFLTQAYFAESAVYTAATDNDDYESANIRFVKKEKAKYKGKPYIFYLYKILIKNDDVSTAYLGLAGGFLPNTKTLQPAKDLSGVYFDEVYQEKNVDLLLKTYLEALEKNREE